MEEQREVISLENRTILFSAFLVVTIFVAFLGLNTIIQMENDRRLYGTIFTVSSDDEVQYLLFDDHNNLSLYHSASTLVNNDFFSLCHAQDRNITILHRCGLSADVSQINSLEYDVIPLNRTRYPFKCLASNGSHFWTFQQVPNTFYESSYYDFRLIGFTLTDGVFLNSSLPVDSLPLFPDLERHRYDSIRYWDKYLYIKGFIDPYNFSLLTFVAKLDLLTLEFESITVNTSFITPNHCWSPYYIMDIDPQGRIWIQTQHLHHHSSADASTWHRYHAYQLDSWNINSTLILPYSFWPDGNLSEPRELLANKYGRIDLWPFSYSFGIRPGLRKTLFSIDLRIHQYDAVWEHRYVGIRINSY